MGGSRGRHVMIRKVLVSVLLAGLLGLGGGPATPASADEVVVGAGVLAAADFTLSVPNGIVIVEIHGKAQFVGNTMVVEFQCEVTSVGAVASTGVDGCSVGDVSGIPVPNNLPGAYSTAAGAGAFSSSGEPPSGCVSGHADWILGGTSGASACGAFIWAAG